LASVDQPFSTDDQNNSNSNGSQSTANSSVTQAPSQSNTQLSGGSGPMGGGAGSATSNNSNSGQTNAATGGANPAPTSSGAYPNLSKYMSANQNWTNSQGQGLGQSVAGNLNQQGQQVNQATNAANSAFQNQGNNWQSGVNQASNTFQSGLANPYASAQNNDYTAAAGQALNANYQGPQNLFSQNQNLNQQAQNYLTNANQTQSAAGQTNLLQQMYGGKGNYNQGEQALDQSLLQNNAQSQAQLQQANQNAIQSNQNLQQSNQSAQQMATNWGNYGKQQQQANIGALNNAVGGVNQNIQNEYQSALAAQPAALAAAQAALQSGNVSQQIANGLGITQGEQFYNVNPNQYVSNANLNTNNTASTGDYQNMQALAKLGALNSAAFNPNSAATVQQYSTAPTQQYNAQNGYLNYDQAGLQNAIQGAAQAYQGQAAGDIGAINSIGNNNNTLYGQFGSQNGAGVGAYGNGTINQNLGITNPTNQNLNTLLAGQNNLSGISNTGSVYNGGNDLASANLLAKDNNNAYGGGQLQAYFNALSNLAGLQNTYDIGNQFNVGS
jgi:hypothetical protein